MATPTTLPASFTAGAVLTAAQMNGVRGAFRILQSLFAWTGTGATSASTTYVTTNLSQAITPSATSSKIKLQCVMTTYTDTAGCELGLRIVKTIAGVTTTVVTFTQALTGPSTVCMTPITWVDEPATTSAITYTVQFARTNGTGNAYVQISNQASTIVVEEISA